MSENEIPKTPPRELLPAVVTHPLTLLITIAVPQLILLIINLRSYYLISDEVNAIQKEAALLLFSGELILFIGGSLFALWRLQRSTHIAWRWNWLLFIPPVVYLSFFAIKGPDIVPDAMQLWIVQPGRVILYQFVFLMPVIFLSALGLACFPMRISIGKDMGASLGLAAGIPLLWYITLHLGRGMWIRHLPGTLILLMVAGSSLICLTGILRIITLLFTWALRKGQIGQSILIALVSIIAPIGGLLLNRSMPFPANFQIWPVYVLTILNGLALTMPKLNHPKIDRSVWLLQCALFPFTLYFFAVFLPYLPLAAIAIIAAGAGFLVLSPTALFVIHLRRLHQGLPSGKPAIIGILFALILPVYAQVEMMIDRAVLHQAIDYVYSPDLKNTGRFKGNRHALRRSLMRLQGVKAGVHLPFLTEWYNQVVLDGLVLNDEKMNHLHFTFFGEPLPAIDQIPESIFGGRSRRSNFGVRTAPPPKNAVLQNVTHSTTTDPANGTRTLVKLELHNPSNTQSEFATTIQIPEGVFVSGYWLLVGEDRVPGQIFEKKTAMWIYRMIRDASRRDPGLLTYLSPNQLSLRVFPFAAREKRITEIEFLSPPGYFPEIRIGKEIISGKIHKKYIAIAKSDDDQQSLFVSAEAAAAIPPTTREPYFHFIVDRSITGLTAREAIASMKEVAAKFPQIKEFTIALANYEFIDAAPNRQPLTSLGKNSVSDLIDFLPRRGAFLAEHSLQRSLSQYRSLQAKSENKENFLRFPVMVLITGSKTHQNKIKDLKWYRSATPDIEGYFVKTHEVSRLEAMTFDGGETDAILPVKPVLIFSSGKGKAIVPITGKPKAVTFDSGDIIEVYDSKIGSFRPVKNPTEIPPESAYSKAHDVKKFDSKIRWNPSTSDELLSTVVDKSRESGILTPSTAYIVVENSAQWKMLKRKEKEKLKGNQALDFMESPEPHLFLLVSIFGFLLLVRRGVKIRRLVSAQRE